MADLLSNCLRHAERPLNGTAQNSAYREKIGHNAWLGDGQRSSGSCSHVDCTRGGRDDIIRASGLTMNRTYVAAPVGGGSTRAAGQRPARRRNYAAMGLFAVAAGALGTPLAIPAARHKQASHKHLPTQARKAAETEHHANTEHHKASRSAR